MQRILERSTDIYVADPSSTTIGDMLSVQRDKPLPAFLNYDPTYFNFFEQRNASLTGCYDASSERRLLMAVLYRALADLSSSEIRLREDAFEYFNICEPDEFCSFHFICNHCEIDASIILTFVNSNFCVRKPGHKIGKLRHDCFS